MKKTITIHYNPNSHPNIKIVSQRPRDPKADLLIMCDTICTMIKLLKDHDIQSLEDSMAMVSDRINAGYIDSDNIKTESVSNKESETWQDVLVKDLNDAIDKCTEATFGELLGIIENVKLDLYRIHHRNMGVL